MSLRASNLRSLQGHLAPVRRVAIDAIQAGQSIIEAGMKQRVPVRRGSLRKSIHSTKVRTTAKRVSGSVVATSPHALYVEYSPDHEPFVRPTLQQDGPRARQAMIATLKKRF